MRTHIFSGLLAGAFLAAGMAGAGSYDMAHKGGGGAQRAIIIQCQNDLGYGAADIRVSTGYASGVRGEGNVLRVVPHGYITPAAALEINRCVDAKLAVVPVVRPRHVQAVAPLGSVCPPGAPLLYRGTLYCPRH